jgi:spore maturation protein CgeB
MISVDGFPYMKRRENIPYFIWETDSFLDRERPQEGTYDMLFIGGAPEDLKWYAKGTVFLPHAFDEELHKPIDVPKEYDLVMIGSDYEERSRLIRLLRDNGFNIYVGRSDPGIPYSTELSKGKLIFNSSKTNWNIPMRFFEGMAIGALVTNDSGNLNDLATPFEHFLPYKTDEELLAVVKEYLKDDAKREKLAKDAREHVLKHHTYKHRVLTMLSYL